MFDFIGISVVEIELLGVPLSVVEVEAGEVFSRRRVHGLLHGVIPAIDCFGPRTHH